MNYSLIASLWFYCNPSLEVPFLCLLVFSVICSAKFCCQIGVFIAIEVGCGDTLGSTWEIPYFFENHTLPVTFFSGTTIC